MRVRLVLAAAASVAAASLAPAAAGRAQASGPCVRLGGESAPGAIEAAGCAVRCEQGRGAATALRLADGRDSTALFLPARDLPGRSLRRAIVARDTPPPSFGAVASHATAEPGGTVPVETRVRLTGLPAREPPLPAWCRPRCDGTAPAPDGGGPGRPRP
ncbi:hypothetical protein [Caldovatus aquaticus]|uniref:Secreted protein n=1 Tax=Caldovatus aquaticus TaxID=2865671 RepID=A0ABS7EXH2_9PROT|nr:hypothetical protein [Caldovatus aquaticus]MBW8268070.1 hypothetical protein [Caldovatus aquaticus]